MYVIADFEDVKAKHQKNMPLFLGSVFASWGIPMADSWKNMPRLKTWKLKNDGDERLLSATSGCDSEL